MSDYLIVFVTTSNLIEARAIAKHCVGKHLAACVNILPKVESYFSWKGQVDHSIECLLKMKTKRDCWEELKKEILAMHSYDIPEIIAIAIDQGNPEYLKWIDQSL